MNCENCQVEILQKYGSGRFCSSKCARGFSTKNKRREINEKVSLTLKTKPKEKKEKLYSYICEKCNDNFIQNLVIRNGRKHHCKKCRRRTSIKYIKNITSLFELSSRTISKILLRLNIGCSNCGWSESSCDLHHINGRKIENCHHHKNLSYLCPNCHRLVHTKKLKIENLINLEDYIGDRWKEFYNI